METCARCNRLIDIHEDQGNYKDGKAYCHDCLEALKTDF